MSTTLTETAQFDATITVPEAGDAFTAASFTDNVVQKLANRTRFLYEAYQPSRDFGSGEDGDLTVTSSDVVLTEPKNYDTISWGSGATGHIFTEGWALRCLTLDLRNAPVAGISVKRYIHNSSGTPLGYPSYYEWTTPGQYVFTVPAGCYWC
jgi:hypothetical protein